MSRLGAREARAIVAAALVMVAVLLPRAWGGVAETPVALGGSPGESARGLAAAPSQGKLIRLQAGSFDPTEAQLAVPSLLQGGPGPAHEDYYIVQFHGTVLPEWRAHVESLGGKLFGYIPDHAYLVRLAQPAVAQVRQLPEVRWVGRYERGHRVSPGLFGRLNSAEELLVTVATFEPDEMGGVVNAVWAEGGEVVAANAGARGGLRVRLHGYSLPRLAQVKGVAWIEEYAPPILLNDQAVEIIHADDIWATPGPGLDGAGQIVAIADSGLDLGVNDSTMHPDLQGRIAGVQALGRETWDDPHGHGTHVAGSVAGNGFQSSGLYAGVAPGASLYFQSVLDGNGGLDGLPTDLTDLFDPAYSAGARIHSNSWGAVQTVTGGDIRGTYTTDSWYVDGFAWDHKDFTILFSAGNSGVDANKDGVIDPDSITTQGTAKNCITVGASENYRPSLDYIWGSSYGAPISSDEQADDPGGLAAFSSRGPTDDGRLKPDLVAPGTWVCSTRTRVRAVDEGFESGALPGDWTAGTGWAVSSADAYAGTYSLANGTPDVSYGGNLNSWVYLPSLDLRSYASGPYGWIEVSIWTRFNIQTDGDLGWLVVDDQRPGRGWYGHSFDGSQPGWMLDRVWIDPSRTLDWSQVDVALVLQTNASNAGGPYYYMVDEVRVYSLVGWRPAEVGLSTDWTTIDESYQVMSGTSMSTPLTAGGVALVRQHYVDDEGITPSAALLKATLVATAADLTPGQYGTDGTQEITGRPDRSQGWGRVDLENAIAPGSPAALVYWDVSQGLQQGERDLLAVEVTDNSVPLRAALVWTDPAPASPSVTPQLVNDLDLTVTDPSDVDHLPMGGAGDHVNNVETVDLATPALGLYTITVEGYDVNGPDQPYALVVYGAAEPVDIPHISQIHPNRGAQGTTDLSVAITGENTHFAAGVSQVSFSGSDITVNTTTVSDATHVTVSISIGLSAAVGKRDVTVTTGDEVASLSEGFEVTAVTLSVSVTPNTWPLGAVDDGVVTTTWTGTTPSEGGYFTATNEGSDTADLGIRVANSAAWTAGSAPEESVFSLGWGQTVTEGTEPSYAVVTRTGVPLVSDLARGAGFSFDLQFRAPTSSTTTEEQVIVATVEAYQP